MQKNVAGQYFHVIAFNTTGRVSGDEEDITCTISVDDGSYSATNDVNPTEISSTGEYKFALTQAETNGNKIAFNPISGTSGVQVLGVPSNVLYTSDTTTIDAILVDTGTTLPAQLTGLNAVAGTAPGRVGGYTLNAHVGETVTFPEIATYDVSGSVLDCSAIALTVTIEKMNGTDVETILDGALTKSSTGIIFTTAAASSNLDTSHKRWAARRDDTGEEVRSGRYNVESIAKGD